MHTEITTRGSNGSYLLLAPDSAPPPPLLPPPSVRQVTGWLTRHPAVLTPDATVQRKAVLAH
ncbi:hypothetical protein DRB96_22650 [Streptomyces sp. ICC1]|nr:hypothetical protein DRB89_34415 [Streptomyces sp. ICC4]AWZ14594.1 hypothetical protein DRB96_22650 [Streptomyces sp. ICC1]